MKILVFLKHVPDTETKIKLAGGGAQLDEADFKYMVNPYDEFAIEEAIQLKSKVGAEEVIVASLGPARVQEAIRKGLAMGADRGIWVNSEGVDPTSLDSLVVARSLASVAQEEAPDIVLLGQKAIDDDAGHVGPMLAELIDAPHVQVVNQVEVKADKSGLEISREVEGGMTEVYSASFPVVLGAHKSLNEPRFPSLPGIMKAKKKPLKEIKFADTQAGQPTTRVRKYALPPEKQPGKVFKGQPVEQMVKEVVGLLRSEAKVI